MRSRSNLVYHLTNRVHVFISQSNINSEVAEKDEQVDSTVLLGDPVNHSTKTKSGKLCSSTNGFLIPKSSKATVPTHGQVSRCLRAVEWRYRCQLRPASPILQTFSITAVTTPTMPLERRRPPASRSRAVSTGQNKLPTSSSSSSTSCNSGYRGRRIPRPLVGRRSVSNPPVRCLGLHKVAVAGRENLPC